MSRTTIAMSLDEIKALILDQAKIVAQHVFPGRDVDFDVPTHFPLVEFYTTSGPHARPLTLGCLNEDGLMFLNNSQPEGLGSWVAWDELVAFCGGAVQPFNHLVTYLVPWGDVLKRLDAGDTTVNTEPFTFHMVRVSDLEEPDEQP